MNFKNLAFWIMLIFVFILGFYVLHWTNTEGYKCLSNTPVYMMQNFEKSNNGADVSCGCTANVKPMPVSFGINRSGLFAYEANYTYSDFNLSSLALLT